jgi:hypothetical protein
VAGLGGVSVKEKCYEKFDGRERVEQKEEGKEVKRKREREATREI